jgi:hypothetical protein
LPTWQITASYSAYGTDVAEGATNVGYNAGVTLYIIVWGFTLLTFLIFSLKNNVVFALILGLVDVAV